MKKQISHVQVPVHDLDDSINWYVTYLGATFSANFGDFAVVEFDEGPSIFLWKTDDITVGGKPFQERAFK